jgi:hypothetical protein
MEGRRMGLKLEDLITAAQEQGWRVEDTKSGVMFYPADPSLEQVLAHRQTPEHSLKKTLSQLRRRGLRWPPT